MTSTKSKRIAFLLLDNFSMMAFTSMIEPMRAVNSMYDEVFYSRKLYSVDGEPVKASNGVVIATEGSMRDLDSLDWLVICGGVDIQKVDHKAINKVLWNYAKDDRTTLIAICTAAYVLAKGGLLDKYRCTMHWENIASFREEMPSLLITNNLYEIDGNRITCSGGTAPLDLMLELINREHGQDTMLAVADLFIHERARPSDEAQKMAEHVLTSRQSPKLAEAIKIMQDHIDDPLSTNEVAEVADVSLRQLERLFKKYKDTTPQRYYLFLRLQQARRLLLQTSLSVLQVTIATGFSSQSHFTKCYRDLFRRTPGSERKIMRIN